MFTIYHCNTSGTLSLEENIYLCECKVNSVSYDADNQVATLNMNNGDIKIPSNEDYVKINVQAPVKNPYFEYAIRKIGSTTTLYFDKIQIKYPLEEAKRVDILKTNSTFNIFFYKRQLTSNPFTLEVRLLLLMWLNNDTRVRMWINSPYQNNNSYNTIPYLESLRVKDGVYK